MRFGKRLEVIGKRLASRLLLSVQPDSTKKVSPPALKHIRSVLFVRPNFRMGNLLMVTPAIRGTRRALPHAQLGLLTTSTYGHMLQGSLDLDQIHLLTRGMIWKCWQWIRLLREIRSFKYDLVVDCSEGESLLGAAFAVFSGARYRLGPEGSKQGAVFNLRSSINGHSKHRIVRLLTLLKYAGIESDDYSMRLDLKPSQIRWAVSRWNRLGFDTEASVVGINLGARGDKRWPMSCFRVLINDLLDHGFRVLLFVGPQELDRLASLEAGLPAEVLVDTTDDPCRFAALLKNCAAFVTADTGPMHLAVAVGTPTVSIFTRANFDEYGPLGPDNRVVFDPASCETKTVLSSLLELLEAPRPFPATQRPSSPAV